MARHHRRSRPATSPWSGRSGRPRPGSAGSIAAQAAIVAVPATLVGVPLGAARRPGLARRAGRPRLGRPRRSPSTLTAARCRSRSPSPSAPRCSVRWSRRSGRPGCGRPWPWPRPRHRAAGWASSVRRSVWCWSRGGAGCSVVTAGPGPGHHRSGSACSSCSPCAWGRACSVRLCCASWRRSAGCSATPGGSPADNVAVRAKALSGALVPLTLAIAFTAVKVILLQTAEHVHRRARSGRGTLARILRHGGLRRLRRRRGGEHAGHRRAVPAPGPGCQPTRRGDAGASARCRGLRGSAGDHDRAGGRRRGGR